MTKKGICFVSVWFACLAVPTGFLSAQVVGSNLRSSKSEIANDELTRTLSEIGVLSQKEDSWLEAEARYDTLLAHDLSESNRRAIQKSLEHLRMKILFSPILTAASFVYTVKAGDSLGRIAQKNHTTVELIQKANRLTTDVIRPGMKLKILKSKFSITVDKSENVLQLLMDENVLKTYSVATGKNNSTPIGTFTIENKLVDPVWYKTGAVIPSGSPGNILGTRWLGFSLAGYGIHGTTLPETIGTQASDGCVRMHNQDVEELFAIVPLKAQVTVSD